MGWIGMKPDAEGKEGSIAALRVENEGRSKLHPQPVSAKHTPLS